jgi:hypothetical protein
MMQRGLLRGCSTALGRQFRRNASSGATTSAEGSVWQEAKNRQGRTYYQNVTNQQRAWEHPGPNATVLKLPKKSVMPELKTISEKVTYLLTNSAGAYYGLFFLICAGLAYRIANPPRPPPPSVEGTASK